MTIPFIWYFICYISISRSKIAFIYVISTNLADIDLRPIFFLVWKIFSSTRTVILSNDIVPSRLVVELNRQEIVYCYKRANKSLDIYSKSQSLILFPYCPQKIWNCEWNHSTVDSIKTWSAVLLRMGELFPVPN